MLSSSISGKTLNTNEKISAIIPLVKAKLNTTSGLHQWNINFKDKTNKIDLNFSKSNAKENFTISVTINEVKKANPDLNLNLLSQRIDVNLWGMSTSSTWDHLIKNITLSLKLNTVKYKTEIVGKKGKEKETTVAITLFNIKQGKEKTSTFDELYKKEKQISTKTGKSFDEVNNKLLNKNS